MLQIPKSRFRITGVSPLLLHNGRLANPLDQATRELAKITSKRKKVDADFLAMARIEFLAGLYLDEKRRPILPHECLKALIVEGAKKTREGTKAKQGVQCETDALLIHEGPATAEELWQEQVSGKRVWAKQNLVKVNKARILRTRPMFPLPWSADIEIFYYEDLVDADNLQTWLHNAGKQGSFDWRSNGYGRFSVERIA